MIRRTALALGILALAASTAQAQTAWPSKPIRLLVPFAAGGTTDLIARVIAEPLGRELGQPVVVENRGGGGGSIGAAETARAAPDGYNLGMATVSTTATNPAINPKIPYNVATDFTPIINIAATPNVIAAYPKLPFQDYKGMLAAVKREPGKYSYASPGNGSITHLMMEMFKLGTQTFMVHVPSRGSGPALTDAVAGQVPLIFDNLPSALGLIQGGKLKALAVTTPQRSSALPQVPTMEEAGVKGYQVFAWFGLAAPAGLPAAVQQKLEQSLERVARNEEVKAAMLKAGAEPAWLGAQAMASFMQADTAQWQKVSAFAKISLD